jgi:hypothetical protein
MPDDLGTSMHQLQSGGILDVPKQQLVKRQDKNAQKKDIHVRAFQSAPGTFQSIF